MNTQRIKHLKLMMNVGRIDPGQDSNRNEESEVHEKCTILCCPNDTKWLMVAEIPNILQSFANRIISLTTLELFFQFANFYSAAHYKTLCDEMDRNFEIIKSLHDLNVRGQITMRLRCWPGMLGSEV